MRVNRCKTVLAAAGISVAAALLSVVAPIAVSWSSAASSSPPWEPDPGAAPPYGNLVLYDANGNQVTSGTDLSDPFAYVVATTAADSGATKAIVSFYNPQCCYPPRET